MQRYNMNDFLARYVSEEETRSFFQTLSRLPGIDTGGPWLAGGALRRLITHKPQDSDFDFFFASRTQYEEFCQSLDCGSDATCLIRETDAYKTYRIDNTLVQAISIETYRNVDAVIDSFDFTITQIAFDGKDLIVGDYTLWDLGRKRLALHKLTYGTASMRRIIKYTRQGFYACPGVMADILEAAVKNPSVINKNTEYID